MRIKKGDTVYIRSGASKGKTGRVLAVNPDKNTILVEGVNKKKRHQRPTQRNPKGGIVTKEAPIHMSNVALYDSSVNGPARISVKIIDDGGTPRRIRVSRKSGQEI